MSCPAEIGNLIPLCDFVEEVSRREGLDEETAFALRLAADEACTNVITHGYAGRAPGPVTLTLDCLPDQVTVILTDFGHPFDPTAVAPPDLDSLWQDRQVGGLGLYFIQQLMDAVFYHADPAEGNRLTMTKNRAPDAPGGP
jgi:serine/threonine-protein kinase RsbW